MDIDSIYAKTDDALSLFKENKVCLAPFYNIADVICDFIKDNNITYSDLSKEGELSQHAVNVAILSGQLGMFYDVEDVPNLVLGSLLHDLGKLYINPSILNKNGKLSEVEKLVVAEHTTLGYKIVKHYTNNDTIADIILNHHTVFEKSPYNTDILELKNKDKYPLICGVADITDAILSYRPYKPPLSKDVVFSALNKKGVTNFKSSLGVLLKDIA